MAGTGFYRPDGPYSWIVLALVIVNTFSTYGFIAGNIGVLTDVLPDLLDEDQATTNIVPSMSISVYLFGMPLITILMRVVGCRVIAAIGAVMGLLGIISSAFATKLWHLVLSYSLVASVGLSFSFVSTIGVIPHYLQKRRAAAYAGIGLGAGIGVAAYPAAGSFLMDSLGFKYAMLSLGTVLISVVAAVIVFKPQLPKEKVETFKELLTSYVRTLKHFVTVFFLINSLFAIGGRAGVVVISFTYIAKYFESSVAVLAFTLYGIGFLVATLGFTLYALKFKANYLVLHLAFSFVLGIAVFILPMIKNEIALYIAFAIVGFLIGAVFGVKGNLIVHLFPIEDIAYIYGLTEAAGGVGSLVIPLCAGFIEGEYSNGAGFYFVGACNIFSSIVLCIAALIRPKLWQDYRKRCQNAAHSISAGLKAHLMNTMGFPPDVGILLPSMSG